MLNELADRASPNHSLSKTQGGSYVATAEIPMVFENSLGRLCSVRSGRRRYHKFAASFNRDWLIGEGGVSVIRIPSDPSNAKQSPASPMAAKTGRGNRVA